MTDFIKELIIYILKSLLGAFAFLCISIYFHVYFVVIVIAMIGRIVLPEEQFNWIEKHFIKTLNRVTDEWFKLFK